MFDITRITKANKTIYAEYNWIVVIIIYLFTYLHTAAAAVMCASTIYYYYFVKLCKCHRPTGNPSKMFFDDPTVVERGYDMT